MWVPDSEDEIKRAVEDGSIRETAAFDAKAAMPPKCKNKGLARHICAMTVDGGVLLYGLGGDDPTRPDKLMRSRWLAQQNASTKSHRPRSPEPPN